MLLSLLLISCNHEYIIDKTDKTQVAKFFDESLNKKFKVKLKSRKEYNGNNLWIIKNQVSFNTEIESYAKKIISLKSVKNFSGFKELNDTTNLIHIFLTDGSDYDGIIKTKDSILIDFLVYSRIDSVLTINIDEIEQVVIKDHTIPILQGSLVGLLATPFIKLLFNFRSGSNSNMPENGLNYIMGGAVGVLAGGVIGGIIGSENSYVFK